MIKLFNRISRAWQASPRSGPAAGSPFQETPSRWSTSLLDPLPLADGNEDENAEWEQWESSMMGLDGRLQGAAPSRRTNGRGCGAFYGLAVLLRVGRKRTT